MRRALLLGLSLLASVVAAQALGLLSVPNTFEAGARMSASAMNANLDAVSGRLLAVRDSVIETRRAQVELRNRVNAVAPGPTSLSSSGSEPDVSLQQSTEPPVRFKAGDLVDADVVNELLSGYAADSNNIAEFNALLVRDMVALSERISAAESALGLPDGERAAADLAAYASPPLTTFRRNERIVPGEMNDNFAALTAGLAAHEHNAAELAAWVAHELARMDAVEAAAGPPVLAEEEYILPVVGSLDPGEFSAGTQVLVSALADVYSDGGYRVREYPGGAFPVSPSGEIDFTLDARALAEGDRALDARTLAQLFLPVYDAATDSRTLSVTNPSALLQAVTSILVEQPDPAGGWGETSHNFRFWVEVENEGVYYTVIGDIVFSDRPVTITGQLVSTSHDHVRELDVSLSAGWNLVYLVPSASQPNLIAYRARPVTPSDVLGELQENRLLAGGHAPEVYGYSLFALHETEGGGEPWAFLSSSRASTASPLYLRVPRWVNHNMAALSLVPVDEVFPGAPGTITSAEPEARLMLADAYAYDQAGAHGGQLGVFGSSTGQIGVLGSNGHPVLFIYSDRSTTVHADLINPEDANHAIRTQADGLYLHMGWNLVEAVLDVGDDLTTTLEIYDGNFPDIVVPPSGPGS